MPHRAAACCTSENSRPPLLSFAEAPDDRDIARILKAFRDAVVSSAPGTAATLAAPAINVATAAVPQLATASDASATLPTTSGRPLAAGDTTHTSNSTAVQFDLFTAADTLVAGHAEQPTVPALTSAAINSHSLGSEALAAAGTLLHLQGTSSGVGQPPLPDPTVLPTRRPVTPSLVMVENSEQAAETAARVTAAAGAFIIAIQLLASLFKEISP